MEEPGQAYHGKLMARKHKNVRKQPELEKEYEDMMELTDPVTGEITYQKVIVKRYKTSPHKEIVGEEDVVESLKSQDRLLTPEYNE